MATFSATDNSAYLSVYGEYTTSPNPTGNFTTVTVKIHAVKTSTQTATQGNSTLKIVIDNTTYSDSGNKIVPDGPVDKVMFTASKDIPHNTDGTRAGIAVSISGGLSGSSWTTSSGSTTVNFTSFDKTPNTPSTPTTITRSNNGTSFYVNATNPGTANSGPTTTVYVQYGTDSSTPLGTLAVDTTHNGFVATTQYYFRTMAQNVNATEYSAWIGPYAGVPSAPTAPTISNAVTTNLTLSWTAPSTNGSTITSYTIQATTDNGSNWSDLYTGVSETTKNVTGLTIAATYKFRIIAVNAVGTSPVGSSSVARFISAYGYRNNGTNFSTPIASAKIFIGIGSPGADAYGWKMIQNVKRWNGTAWTDLQS